MAQGFFGRLKTEMFFGRDWLSTSTEDCVAALDAYIRWYDEVRIESSLGFRGPAQHPSAPGHHHITSPSFCPHPPRLGSSASESTPRPKGLQTSTPWKSPTSTARVSTNC
ncbi:IS3 family transposase [Ideonella dechloratans]|uniref:IS3 family transposase n=1 Tax=Ideonella dechloratans TaxID=36863 RepID=UPI0035AFF212